MSFINTIPADKAEGLVRDMYERQQDAWGYVPNYAKSFCHRPEVMARWGRLLAELKRPMDKRRFELVTFVAAVELRHTSCSLAHGNALKPFFSNADILAIADRRPTGALTDAEQEMLDFARLVARDAASIKAADVQRLRDRGFSDAEVFDIAGVAAGRAFFTKILDAVGSLPDSAFGAIDEEIRLPLVVGRPLESAAAEVMSAAKD